MPPINKDAVILITGASQGIGFELAQQFQKVGYRVVGVARTLPNQQYLFDAQIMDVTNEEAIKKTITYIQKKYGRLDVLINNAGYGLWGAVETTPWDQLDNMMQLNMNAVVQLCHALIPELKRHSKSYILNVASTASYQAVPTLATYAATKGFVVLFTRGLRMELKGTPISVTCLSPGATSTNFIDRAGMESMKEKAEKFSMKPEAVAKIAIDGMFKGKAEILPGFVNWISVQLTYFMPKAIPEKIAEGLYKTK
jgi:short-subunit dehydrogenase